MNSKPLKFVALLGLLMLAAQAAAAVPESSAFNRFLVHMVDKYGFDEEALRARFNAVQLQPAVLETMPGPEDAGPWHEYRDIIMTPERIDAGVRFWQDNEQALTGIESRYRVPAEILVAIIGVESKYGEQIGKYREIDVLSTLSFSRTPLKRQFTGELADYLLLCRQQGLNPLKIAGSASGGMGLTQFLPSRFRHFAVDFDHDRKSDIWQNGGDAAASVARFLSSHHWRHGEAVAFPVKAVGDAYRGKLVAGLKPDVTVAELRRLGVDIPSQLPEAESVKLLVLQHANGEEMWVGLNNFHVISRYRPSASFAMAVYQLSQAIADRKKALHSAAELQK